MAGTVLHVPEAVHGAGMKVGNFFVAQATLVAGTQTVTVPAGLVALSCVRSGAGGTVGHLDANIVGTTLTVNSSDAGDTSDVFVLMATIQA